jgi:molybdate transport system ATP-binding protein
MPVLIISHDLEDVRHMADHIGIMIDGRIRRFGDREQVFAHPGSYQVARVLGWRNFLFIKSINHQWVAGPWGRIELSHEIALDSFCLAIRPEHIRLVSEAEASLAATVEQVVELGAVRELSCRLQDGSILILHRPWNEPLPASGAQVFLQLPEQHLQALPEWCERERQGKVARPVHNTEVNRGAAP